MSYGINKVILLGRLGANPEVTTTKPGNEMASFSIATESKYIDKNSGEKISNTEWHRIVTFGAVARIIREYVFKGSQIYIEGSLKTRKWKDKSGSEHYITEVIGRELVMLDSKNSEKQNKEKIIYHSVNDDFDDIPF